MPGCWEKSVREGLKVIRGIQDLQDQSALWGPQVQMETVESQACRERLESWETKVIVVQSVTLALLDQPNT